MSSRGLPFPRIAIRRGGGEKRPIRDSSRFDREYSDAAARRRHLLGESSVHAFLAEHRRQLFPDERFATCSRPVAAVCWRRPTSWQRSWSSGPSRSWPTGRPAGHCRRSLPRAPAGLATPTALHPTALTRRRNKRRASERPQRIVDAMGEAIARSGVIAGGHCRARRPTVFDAAARQDTITMLVIPMKEEKGAKRTPELGRACAHEENLEGGRPPCDNGDGQDIDHPESRHVHKTAAPTATRRISVTPRPHQGSSQTSRQAPRSSAALAPAPARCGRTSRRGRSPAIKSAPLRAAVPAGHTLDDFAIEKDERATACPAGVTAMTGAARAWPQRRESLGSSSRLEARDGRRITLQCDDALLAAARETARTDAFDDIYRRHLPTAPANGRAERRVARREQQPRARQPWPHAQADLAHAPAARAEPDAARRPRARIRRGDPGSRRQRTWRGVVTTENEADLAEIQEDRIVVDRNRPGDRHRRATGPRTALLAVS